MKPNKRTTYLSRVESNYCSQKWYSRSVSIFAKLLFTGEWLRKTQITTCLIVELSEGGATVRTGKLQVPDQVYLVFGRFELVVGSVVVQRDPGSVHLCFVKSLTPAFVNRLARSSHACSGLESSASITISRPEGVQPRLSSTPAPPGTQNARPGQTFKHPKSP